MEANEQEEVLPGIQISFSTLIFYLLLFMVPLIVTYFFSSMIGSVTAAFLQVSKETAAKIYMVPLSMVLFAFLIPYIRTRESIQAIRFTIFAVILTGAGLAIPPIVTRGDYALLFSECIYFANYLLLTFIYCPEVLGIIRDIKIWFKHHGQLVLILIYIAIGLFYIFGFGSLYHAIAETSTIEKPYFYGGEEKLDLGAYVYFSLITYATVGYGDISPHATAARLVASIEAMLGLLINVVFIAILLTFISGTAGSEKAEEIEREIATETKEIEGVYKKGTDETTKRRQRVHEYVLSEMRNTKKDLNKYIEQVYTKTHQGIKEVLVGKK